MSLHIKHSALALAAAGVFSAIALVSTRSGRLKDVYRWSFDQDDPVRLTDERRYAVPVAVVCPEFSPDEARAWAANGDMPELTRATDVSYVDIDTGHWPMFTAPAELARVLADVVSGP